MALAPVFSVASAHLHLNVLPPTGAPIQPKSGFGPVKKARIPYARVCMGCDPGRTLRSVALEDLVEHPGQNANGDAADQRTQHGHLDANAEEGGEIEDQRVDHECE